MDCGPTRQPLQVRPAAANLGPAHRPSGRGVEAHSAPVRGPRQARSQAPSRPSATLAGWAANSRRPGHGGPDNRRQPPCRARSPWDAGAHRREGPRRRRLAARLRRRPARNGGGFERFILLGGACPWRRWRGPIRADGFRGASCARGVLGHSARTGTPLLAGPWGETPADQDGMLGLGLCRAARGP